MRQLKLVWYDSGKKNSTAITVSVKEAVSFGLSDVISPTDISGSGSCYGNALQDFASQLDEYIEELCKFRDEIVNTSKAYTEAIEVDFGGKPINH